MPRGRPKKNNNDVNAAETLISKFNFSETQIKAMSPQEIDESYKKAVAIEEDLKKLEETGIKADVVATLANEDSSTTKRLPTDVDFTDYVLSLLDPKERDSNNGCPKVDGLRRVAELILGRFQAVSTIRDCPSVNNNFGAVVQVDVTFREGIYNGLTYSGSADVSERNTNPDFAKHSVATAETRAEGRALRKALKLTQVLAAEELDNAPKDNVADKIIPKTMIASLEQMAYRSKVNLLKLAIKEFNINDIQLLNKEQGLKLCNTLGELHRKLLDGEEIPEEIRA